MLLPMSINQPIERQYGMMRAAELAVETKCIKEICSMQMRTTEDDPRAVKAEGSFSSFFSCFSSSFFLSFSHFIGSTSYSVACSELIRQCVAGLRHGVFDLKWRKTHHGGFYCCHVQFPSARHTSFYKPCHPTTALTKRCPLDLDHGVVAPAHSFTDKPRGICAAMDTIAGKKKTFIGDQIHQQTGQASLTVLWRAQSQRRQKAAQRPQWPHAGLTFSSCLAH